jgi:hypothetical protein
MAGVLKEEALTGTRDEGGGNFLQAAKRIGYAQSQDAQAVMSSAKEAVSNVDFFVELHIEQGAVPTSGLVAQCWRMQRILASVMSQSAVLMARDCRPLLGRSEQEDWRGVCHCGAGVYASHI